MTTARDTHPPTGTQPAATTAGWVCRIATIDLDLAGFTGASEAELHRQGVELHEYRSPACALLDIGAHPPQAVLVPTHMAGMPLLEVVRSIATSTDIPVWVGITDDPASQALGFRALEHGARTILPLPVSPRRLTQILAELRSRPTQVGELRCGPVSLDPQSLRVAVSGTLVHLAPREFQVLEYLMRHAPRVISLDELNSYGARQATGSRESLRMTIGRARKKLDQALEGPGTVIETVRGVGYRMAD